MLGYFKIAGNILALFRLPAYWALLGQVAGLPV